MYAEYTQPQLTFLALHPWIGPTPCTGFSDVRQVPAQLFQCRLSFNFDGTARIFTVPGLSYFGLVCVGSVGSCLFVCRDYKSCIPSSIWLKFAYGNSTQCNHKNVLSWFKNSSSYINMKNCLIFYSEMHSKF